MKFQNPILKFVRMDGRRYSLTFGFVLNTYNVRKSSQESVSTQQIPVFYGIPHLSVLAPFICK